MCAVYLFAVSFALFIWGKIENNHICTKQDAIESFKLAKLFLKLGVFATIIEIIIF